MSDRATEAYDVILLGSALKESSRQCEVAIHRSAGDAGVIEAMEMADFMGENSLEIGAPFDGGPTSLTVKFPWGFTTMSTETTSPAKLRVKGHPRQRDGTCAIATVMRERHLWKRRGNVKPQERTLRRSKDPPRWSSPCASITKPSADVPPCPMSRTQARTAEMSCAGVVSADRSAMRRWARGVDEVRNLASREPRWVSTENRPGCAKPFAGASAARSSWRSTGGRERTEHGNARSHATTSRPVDLPE
jgi:hypothetical protein